MSAPRAGAEDVEIEMPEQNHHPQPPHPASLPPSVNPSLNVSRADSDMRTEDMSDYGADRETIGARYACPNLGCGTGERPPVYSNPKYAQGGVPSKKRYPTLDRPPSRAASQSTVHSTDGKNPNQSTADLVGKKGEPNAKPDSGALAKFKSFWRDPRYDKLRAIILIVILVIILLLIIILPIVLRKPAEEEQVPIPAEYEVVKAPLAACGDLMIEGYKKAGVTEFRGIPYAVPPLNEHRWRASVPLDSSNCRDLTYTKADHFGHQCYQSHSPRTDMESEDCLYLNVWTPSNSSAAEKLPVMVYIHGGDFRTGSGNDINQYPLRKIVEEGRFVLVSMNYRLQALGFMALEALEETNVGLTDIVAALQWVQGNIGGFGGDKGKVTVSGLGSGGTAILALMNNNATSEGLFHRAWLMSPGTVQDQPLVASKAGNADYVTNLGCQAADNTAIKQCLYGKTASELLTAVPWYTGPQWAQTMKYDVPQQGNTTGPYIVTDDLVGNEGTFDMLKAQSLANKNIPVIIGNSDSDAAVRPPAVYFGDGTETRYLDDFQLRTNVHDRLKALLNDPDLVSKIQNDYPSLETELGFSRLVSDIRALCPANHVADYLHKMGVETYRYIYEFKPVMRVNAFNHHNFWAAQTFQGIDMLAFFGALDGEEFSPYFTNPKQFAEDLRKEIYKFMRGEAMTWSPMPQYMSLTASANVAASADTTNYPRNCAHWTTIIPGYSWSN